MSPLVTRDSRQEVDPVLLVIVALASSQAAPNSQHMNDQSSTMALGMALGIAIGTAIGAAMDNIPIGIAVGIALGAAVGAAYHAGKGR